MKASDTVIPVLPHSESVWCPHCGEEFGIESRVEDERITQAEISFQAGKQVGIKEVVEWVNEHNQAGLKSTIYFLNRDWQSKLKEWGLE